jgi:hypothetical protein
MALCEIAKTVVSGSVVPVTILGTKLAYQYAKRWWTHTPLIEIKARKALSELDACDMGVEAADSVMETHSVGLEKPRRRCRRRVAASYALQAYLKFGDRPKSSANVLVTRKYISDLLTEKQHLRLRDKVEIMDLAVFLSFVPTKMKLECDAMMNTTAYAERVFGEWQNE